VAPAPILLSSFPPLALYSPRRLSISQLTFFVARAYRRSAMTYRGNFEEKKSALIAAATRQFCTVNYNNKAGDTLNPGLRGMATRRRRAYKLDRLLDKFLHTTLSQIIYWMGIGWVLDGYWMGIGWEFFPTQCAKPRIDRCVRYY
jgi:hypothetical protein